jgi:hypothetical protein
MSSQHNPIDGVMKQKKQSYTKMKKKNSQKYKGLFLISKNQNKEQSFNSKSNQQMFLKFNYIHCTKLQQYTSYLYYLLSMVKGERNQLMIWGFAEFRTDNKILPIMTKFQKLYYCFDAVKLNR